MSPRRSATSVLACRPTVSGRLAQGQVIVRRPGLELSRLAVEHRRPEDLLLVGLVIGITWIVQGLAALVTGFSGGAREGRGWWIFFGFVSLIAGIVVTAVPTTSVTVLAVLVGIWFIVQGLMEIIGGFMIRHTASKSQASHGQPTPT